MRSPSYRDAVGSVDPIPRQRPGQDVLPVGSLCPSRAPRPVATGINPPGPSPRHGRAGGCSPDRAGICLEQGGHRQSGHRERLSGRWRGVWTVARVWTEKQAYPASPTKRAACGPRPSSMRSLRGHERFDGLFNILVSSYHFFSLLLLCLSALAISKEPEGSPLPVQNAFQTSSVLGPLSPLDVP